MTPSSTPSTHVTPTSQKPSSSTLTTTLLNYAVFTFLSIILLCLIILTPADAIYQCYVTHRLTNIFIITGGYVVTFLFFFFIFSTLIYTNRTVLSGIPKAWIPVEREDVGKSVRRLVVEGLRRSALVAYGARPRDLSTQDTAAGARGVSGNDSGYGAGAVVDGADDSEEIRGLLRGFDYDIDPAHPPWGIIEHPGWSAPSAAPSAVGGHLPPDLCYRTVVRELPHLIEAKAVSLAPPDPIFSSPTSHLHTDDWARSEEEIEGNIPDTRIVEILRRSATTSLRGYMQHLTEMGVINPPESGTEFLSLYERARFSGRDLHESEFRELMGVFADVLRGMRFSPEHLDPDHQFLDMDMNPDRRRGTSLFASETQSESILGPSDEEGETETDTLGSASISLPANSPAYGFARHQRFANENLDGASRGSPQRASRTPSTHSLRPVRSHVSGGSGSIMSSSAGSGSGGSVIRLADARAENASGLPYVIHNNR
ncbi:hypothetical protein ASPCAL01927 [Aspergillus calidoustus]|uniref:Defect at low temperature protein 1 n=1 Tax=Aspergillus calidoustus TaxID=454130 RepID=A0A0U5GMG5_ASPCI|nr:hypothetical protein ASPCAL01927 [Aspergillus calidoustus]